MQTEYQFIDSSLTNFFPNSPICIPNDQIDVKIHPTLIQDGLEIIYQDYINGHSIELIDKDSSRKVAHFSITDTNFTYKKYLISNRTQFNINDANKNFLALEYGTTKDMSINIDDAYTARGYSRYLIYKLCQYIKFRYPTIRHDQLLFIDSDASAGFWTYIGMRQNRMDRATLAKVTDREGYGYEALITFLELYNFGAGIYPGYIRKNEHDSKYREITGGKTKRKRKRKTMNKK